MDFPHRDQVCALQQLLRTFLRRYVAYAALRNRRRGPNQGQREPLGELEAAPYRTYADSAAPSV